MKPADYLLTFPYLLHSRLTDGETRGTFESESDEEMLFGVDDAQPARISHGPL